jgi:hypothetical protein
LYHRLRKKAAKAATWRAAMMTKIGTSGGRIWSVVRNTITWLLLHSPLKAYLASVFSMQSVPHRNLGALRHNSKKVLNT